MTRNNQSQIETSRKALIGLVLLGLFMAVPAKADLAVSQTIVLKNTILDEFDRPLEGNDPSASEFGIPHVKGDLVQVLLATDGVIYPPDENGNPDSRNQLIGTSCIGRGTLPHLARPGNFGTSISPRPGGNSKIFVRVFNSAELGEATYYGDSALFTVSSSANKTFVADIAKADKPLKGGDADGDGLSDGMEQGLGSDANLADSDGDGILDSHEYKAKTDLLDADDFLRIASLVHTGSGEMDLGFDSKTDVKYRVEYFPAGQEPTQANVVLLAKSTGNGRKMVVKGNLNGVPEGMLFRVVLDE